jgi:WD40 repeat protein
VSASRGPLAPGARLGPYTIGEHLGSGGQGVVYRAIEAASGIEVALKVLPPETGTDREFARRLAREAAAASAFAHPNIARLFFQGELDRIQVMAFELVPGGSLDRRLAREGRLSWREAVRLGAGIARALEVIHAAGLVHRDVKPANVLLSASGEPKLTDFGLVKFGPEASRLTATGEILGTVAYMAPEQLDGAKGVDGRADLYALGATLYALVSGTPPFLGASYELMKKVLIEKPRRLREVVREVPEALDALVARLLEKDPSGRGDASTVARELEAIAAPSIEAVRSKRGHRAVLGAAGVAALAALAWVALPRGAPAPTPRPRSGPTPAPSSAATVAPTASSSSAFAEILEVAGFSETRRTRLASVLGTYRWKHAGGVEAVAYFPDGRNVLTGSADGTVRMWDVSTGRDTVLRGQGGPIYSVAVSHDGKHVAGGDVFSRVRLWDLDRGLETPARLLEVPRSGEIGALAFSTDDTRLVAGSVVGFEWRLWNELSKEGPLPTGELATWSVATGASEKAIALDAAVGALVSLPGTGFVVGALFDGTVRTWDAASLEERMPRYGVGDVPIGSLAISGDGRFALTGTESAARLWSLPEWAPVGKPRTFEEKENVWGVALSRDGKRAAATAQNQSLLVWGTEGESLTKLKVPYTWGRCVAFSPDGDRLVTGSNPFVDVWDLARPTPLLNHDGDGADARIRVLALSPDEKLLVVGTAADTVTVRELPTGKVVGRLSFENQVLAGRFESDTSFVVGTADLSVYHCSAEGISRAEKPALGVTAERADVLAFAFDGRMELVGFEEEGAGTLGVLRPGTEADLERVSGPSGRVTALAVSRDGRSVVTGDGKGFATLWEIVPAASSIQVVRRVDTKWKETDTNTVAAAAFSPNSSDVVLATSDGRLLRWNRGRDITVFREREPTHVLPLSLAFSPDGKLVVSTWDDGRILLMDADGHELDTIDLRSSADNSFVVAFTKDSGTLFVGTQRGVVLRFDLK